MKVYVDELPETCLDCENVLCEHQIIEACYATRHPDCPLFSLADYTKQVRKEVIDKVYAVLEQAVPHDLCWSWAVIKKELEQIKGETKWKHLNLIL